MILDFLKTKRDKADLKIALEVIQEFINQRIDDNESTAETPWIKLEQLEAILKCLIIDKPIDEKALDQIAASAAIADIW